MCRAYTLALFPRLNVRGVRFLSCEKHNSKKSENFDHSNCGDSRASERLWVVGRTKLREKRFSMGSAEHLSLEVCGGSGDTVNFI